MYTLTNTSHGYVDVLVTWKTTFLYFPRGELHFHVSESECNHDSFRECIALAIFDRRVLSCFAIPNGQTGHICNSGSPEVHL